MTQLSEDTTLTKGELIMELKQELATINKTQLLDKPIFYWIGPASSQGGRLVDLQGIIEGRYFCIMAKTARSEISDRQNKWASKVLASGGLCFIARNVSDLREALGIPERIESIQNIIRIIDGELQSKKERETSP